MERDLIAKCEVCGRLHCKNQKHVPLTLPDWVRPYEDERQKEIKKHQKEQQ